MKFILAALAVVSLLACVAWADIQDPPRNDQGPTRKLGRAISNIAFGVAEIPVTTCLINEREGNSAAASYGVVKGVGRTFARAGFGVFELITFPFPTTKGTYRQPYRSNIPWIHGGYEEFPPELGFETKARYIRMHTAY